MKARLKELARKQLSQEAYDRLANGVVTMEALLKAPGNRLKARAHTNGLDSRHESRRVFGYDRALLPNRVLREIDGTDLQTAQEKTGLSMGYPAWNLLYYSLLCSLPPDVEQPVVIETGTNLGLSTVAMAQALKDAGRAATVRTVDIDPAVVQKARANVEAAGLSAFVDFYVQDSRLFLAETTKKVEAIHFAFLDGSHSYTDVRREFEIIYPRVAACRGKIYFDNTISGGVARALRYIRLAYSGNLVEFQNCSWMPPGNAIWQAN